MTAPQTGLRAKEVANLLIRDPDLRIIRDRNLVLEYVEYFKRGGMRIGFVGGVYDMLHDAHMLYLLEGQKACDILIIALDDDALTRKRKNNPNRPFDSEDDRARALCLAAMGHIVTFRGVDEHPYDLIRLLRPDVLITSKGTPDVNDGDRDALKEYCTEVLGLEPMNSKSTTAKFARFAKLHGVETLEKIVVLMNSVFGPLGVRLRVVEDGVEEHE
jgi:bifunctional ADP-heptose synthase (sugar kinase/adenylyltransferase)